MDNQEIRIENEISKQKAPVKWILFGLCLCLVSACIYTSLYGIFKRRAASMDNSSYNPLETQNSITYLYQNCYLLYRDLYNKQNQTSFSYGELYLKPTESNDWLNSQSGREQVQMGDYSTLDEDVDPEDLAAALESYAYLEEHFQELEGAFSQLNSIYDYIIQDNHTGMYLTNLQSPNIDIDKQFYYLSFVFDTYGNVTMGSTVRGSDVTIIRKTANEVIRNCSLENLLSKNFGEDYASENSLYTLQMPLDCTVTFCISQADYSQLQEGVYLYYNDSMSSSEVYVMADPSNYYYLSGCIQTFAVMGILLFLLGMFVPVLADEMAWDRIWILRMPFEILFVILCVSILAFGEMTPELVCWLRSGHALETVLQTNGYVDMLLAYGLNILALTAMFFLSWYVGVALRSLRELGPGEYFRKRCLLFQLLPGCGKLIRLCKERALAVYDAVVHFDVTKDAHRLILKIVLINALILFAISSLWMGGLAVACIYSILLYFLLRKYISDLQKKYSLLLKATNEIAQGNLNVSISEDLGVFEPFKPQIYRIQEGFRNAVAEEVKSQRMKSELITNVSHDLKTPLTAIITYVKLLQEPGITEDQRKEYLDTLERKSLRLKALIEDLFEVSKANSQNITLDICDVDIINLVKQAALELSDKLTASGLDVRIDLPPKKVIVPLDSQKTYRVFENLFGNIAKYALPGTRVYVNGFTAKDEVTIILKNITAQELTVSGEELTERFVRGDSSRNTEGSGLGLAIARSFTEIQDGKFSIQLDGDLFKAILTWKVKQQETDTPQAE